MSPEAKKWIDEHSSVEACHVALVTKQGVNFAGTLIGIEIQRMVFEAVGLAMIAAKYDQQIMLKDPGVKKTDPYTGPFPRKKHSHKCLGCIPRGQYNAVACYKKGCTMPQTTETCSWCRL